ncbi:MAG: ComF family protein [Candidatus Nitricoxidivorans perseverans]|uniref:ComF family protein n=1 Tax=Candidatus Nitricoxidivorans perseverans TaxID=2975601 RepID=A0AA49FKE4_9PROT|nr:MAG: ComF family protein [Candidatus Nitricoxidivorans perseverans]
MSIWAAALDTVLPCDCLLCGAQDAAGPPRNICAACEDDLPRLPPELCPVCAETAPGGAVCGQCLKSPPHFDATFAAFRYAFPLDKLVQALKYGHRLAIADFCAQALQGLAAPIADLIVPLPLSAQRLAERGFNQSVEIARPLARALGLPLLLDGCTRPVDTVPQAMLPWKARRNNVRHAFECAVDLSGKSVIVVDDVMTTGSTLDEFARILKAHGAASVTNLVVARALRE